MSYIQVCGVPRQVFAEESLTVTFSGTPVVNPNATYAAGSLMVRARLQGGPIRFKYLTSPSTTDGTPVYDSDVAEWTGQEISALASTGGFIVASTATANAILYLTFYR